MAQPAAQGGAGLEAQFNAAMTACFGQNSTQEQRSEADRWLQHFQQTNEAWEVSVNLLGNASLSPEILFFAANTLHGKIQYEFYDLPQENQAGLRDAISGHLMRWGLTPGVSKALTKRLCLCAAALAVQMNWREVFESIPALIAKAAPGTELSVTKVALDLLACLPDECNSYRLECHPDTRDAFQVALDQSVPQVLAFLSQTAARADITSDAEGFEGVLVALGMWVKFCKIPPDLLAQQPLLGTALDLLANPQCPPDLFEADVDTLVGVLRRYDASPEHMNLVQIMVPKLMALQPRFVASVNEAKADVAQGGDGEGDDVSRGLCRLFTEMGESYIKLILSPDPLNQVAVVQIVLDCTSHPDADIGTIPLWFWFRLVKEWRNLEDTNPLKAQHHATFSPLISNLVGECVRLLSYPTDIDEMGRQERDDVAYQRQKISDTLYDCCQFLGGEVVLTQVYTKLGSDYAALEATGSWVGLEACVMAVHQIAKDIPASPIADEKLMQMINMLLHLQTSPSTAGAWSQWPRLRYTACKFIGSLAPLFRRQSQLLSPLFTFLYSHLTVKETVEAAASAIQDLCERCSEQLGEPVLSLYDQINGETLEYLELKDELSIINGLSSVVRKLDLVSARRSVQQLLSPICQRLTAAVNDPSPSPKRMIAELERLVAVIKPLEKASYVIAEGEVHPLVQAVETFQLWPLLDTLFTKFATSEPIAEKGTRVYRYMIKACKQHFAPLLEMTVQRLLQHFSNTGFAAFVYIASTITSQFSRNTYEMDCKLLEMLGSFSQLIFPQFQAATPADTLQLLTNKPDLVEEYFYLCSKFMDSCPRAALEQGQALSIACMQFGVIATTIDHREANGAVLAFFESVIGAGIPRESTDPALAAVLRGGVDGVMAQQGQAVVSALLEAAAGVRPSPNLEDGKGGTIAGVLWKLARFNAATLSTTLMAALAAMDERVVDNEERGKFMAELGGAIQTPSKEHFCRTIVTFLGMLNGTSEDLNGHNRPQHKDEG
eukprot:CAMPEP_0182560400 /NCGR_PEP_ID=MMETSP1324-20130603/3107_1 /TAXON_ID=236786 /ORGANISM="Florenciella sp., Strain RCC1587" /LENGTH=1004 /DNA_ID=CAMNT_0024772745 /DNA_START=219 /DNA_END=3234 /DNA_ORIENTATION=-